MDCGMDLGAAEKGHLDCAKELRVICCEERHLACVMNLRGAAEMCRPAYAKAAGGEGQNPNKTQTKPKTGLRVI